MGHNGGPEWNWRAEVAGDDAKALEALARYQSPKDLGKAFIEQRTALSKRAEPVRLADNATPEQVAEYRKGLGVPEIAKDAKPDDYLAAYKIEAPKDYQLTAVERGMLSDYAKLAYEQGHSPREVKAASDFFFQQQQASGQALNRIAVDFEKAQQNAWRDEVGSKEYEAQTEAANAWIRQEYKDDPDGLVDLLNARMPSGGLLKDQAWFGKLIAKQAMGAGFTDRIEANALESGGRSAMEQIREIEGWMFSDRAKYNEAAKPGGRLDRLYQAANTKGAMDDQGNEVRRRRAS